MAGAQSNPKSFPIEEGGQFARLIERYELFVNADSYPEGEALDKAFDPEAGHQEKYEECIDRYSYGERAEPRSEEPVAALLRAWDQRSKQRAAEYDAIMDSLQASAFWHWLMHHPNFVAAINLFMKKRKFPQTEYCVRDEISDRRTQWGQEMDEGDLITFILLAARSLIAYHEITDDDIVLYRKLRARLQRRVAHLNRNILCCAATRPWVADQVRRILPDIPSFPLDPGKAHPHARREWFIKDVANKYHYNFLAVHADVLTALTEIIDPNITERRIYALLASVRKHLNGTRFDDSRPERYDPVF